MVSTVADSAKYTNQLCELGTASHQCDLLLTFEGHVFQQMSNTYKKIQAQACIKTKEATDI